MSAARLKAWRTAHGDFLKPKEKAGKPVFDEDSLLRLKVLAELYRKGHSEAFIKELTLRHKPGALLFEAVLGGAPPAPAAPKAQGLDRETALAVQQMLLLLADLHQKLSKPPPPPPAPPPGPGQKELTTLQIRLDELFKGMAQQMDQQLHQLRTQRHESRVVLESVDGRLEVLDKRLRDYLRLEDTSQEDLREALSQASHQLSALQEQVTALQEAEQQTKEMHHRMVSETRNLLRSLEETDPEQRRGWIRGLKQRQGG